MTTSFFWFRRDLRLFDNHGLYRALKNGTSVLPVFIFDSNILQELPSDDARVTFIYNSLQELKSQLSEYGSDLIVRYGEPLKIWTQLLNEYEVNSVYTNHDYEPYAKSRDEQVKQLLKKEDISFRTFKDHVIFESKEVLSKSKKVYTVFTPYKRRWLEHFKEQYLDKKKSSESFYPSEDHLNNLLEISPVKMLEMKSMGFQKSSITFPSKEVGRHVIREYLENRNFPGKEEGTSKLGIHFRFGTISIRDKALKASSLSQVYLSELIWRDFYSQILDIFPHVVDRAFRSKYDKIPWRDSEDDFQKWCEGKTGYPIVDAGMRELNVTGYMHNRVRMVTASFLTKHLLIDWRKGEAYFALKLLDYDLASNNGGWQWASGSGTDAAPYFRIFNPTTQLEKFDKQRTYVKKWIPEYGTDNYIKPMIDHKFARERCLEVYKAALSET